MDDMQAIYDDEVGSSSGGLMSLLRGTGDVVLGEDIMDNLPMLLRALEGTNKDTLTMQETRDMSGPMDESSLSVQLSNTPGLSSILGPEAGMLAAMAGGPTGKSKSFKELIDEIQRLAGRMGSDKDMDATRYANEANLPDFLKSYSQKKKERTDKEMYEQRPSRNMPRDPDLDKGLGSLDPMMEDAVKKAEDIRNPSYVIEEMQDTVDSFGKGVKSKKYIPAARTREQGEEALARLGERE